MNLFVGIVIEIMDGRDMDREGEFEGLLDSNRC